MGTFFLIVCLVAAAFIIINALGKGDGLTSYQGDNRIGRYQNMVHPDLGMIESRLLRMKINSHYKTQEVVNQVTRVILEGIDHADYARRKQVFRDEQFEIDLLEMRGRKLELRIKDQLMAAAAAEGLDIVTYLKLFEHREMKNIDLQAMAAEYNIKQEQMSRIQQEVLELVDRSTHRLFSLYDERKRLENSNDLAKSEKLGMLNYNIQVAEELIRGEQDKYFQTTLGQERGRTFSNTDSGGRNRGEETEDQKQNRKPGRPRGSRNRSANK